MFDRDGLPDHDEPTPWTLGVLIAVLSGVFVTCLLIGLYDVVAQSHVLLGLAAVLVVCGGAAPTAWTWRRKPVLRWLSWGAMVGLSAGGLIVVLLAAAGVR